MHQLIMVSLKSINMLKLFAVVLGGRALGCNIELHDVVFITGNSIVETYARLVNKWFGITKRLHIDSTVELSCIDGHTIELSQVPTKPNKNKLFFVNFGGYKPGYFGEIHDSAFYIAATKTEALARAKKALGLDLEEPHCDDNIDIDDIITVSKIDQYYLHLTPTTAAPSFNIVSGYRRLDVPDIIASAKALQE
jgi:hypothetical protein